VFESEIAAGSGEVFGAVRRSAIGQDVLDCDVVQSVKVDGPMKSVEDALDFFVWEQAGEGQAGMIIDGDVETFDAGARVAHGPITGGADSRTAEAAQFLNVEMEELAWVSAFVANHRRSRFQSCQPLQAVTAKDAGNGGLGDADHGEDLSVRAPLTAQGEDVCLELGSGFARLAAWDRGAIVELRGEARLLGALEPSANGLFRDVISGGDGA